MSERNAMAAPKLGASSAAPTLQRKCACGRSASQLVGDCPDCQREKQKLQKKLRVGSTDDPLEHEADRAAERVLALPAGFRPPRGRSLPPLHPRPPQNDSTSHAPSRVHGAATQSADVPVRSAPSSAPVARAAAKTAPGGRSEAAPGARRAAAASAPPVASDEADTDALTQGGTPLDPGLRSFFEARFGRDLSSVRVHTGLQSEALNQRLDAHAFTYSDHIWLGRGHRPRADFLLAHELAHVIQQRQPDRVQSTAGDESAAAGLSGTGLVVQRLGDEFWVPLGAAGKRTGSDIHGEMQGLALANNGDLDIEPSIPNASLGGVGLGLQGRADFYRGKGASGLHAKPGIFFDGPTGATQVTIPPAKPEKLQRGTAGTVHPFLTATGGIGGIADAPRKVELGELKPAANPLLDHGEKQLANYKEGLELARKLTNEWARQQTGVTDRWNLSVITRLDDKAVNFGADMKFNPSSPKDNEVLALARMDEKPGGVGYTPKVIFNPGAHGLTIKGGLYGQIARPGKGLWMYFARPKDLKADLASVRSIPKRAEMEIANLVQDQIINPLVKTPKKKTPLLRDRTREPQLPPPVVNADPSPVIRRAPKTPEMTDDFKFTPWKEKQEEIHGQLFGAKATDATKKELAGLELLEHAYKAEDTIEKVPGAPKRALPARGTDKVEIFSGKAPNRKREQTRNLEDMSSWLKGWTGKPAQVLGFFRDKFGDSFVTVANKLTALRDRIREKWKAAFESRSKPGSSRARIIAKAILKALHQVAKVLIPRAVHLFMDAVIAGSKKKLTKMFNIEPEKLLEDTFGTEFKATSDKLTQFKDDAQKHVDKVVDDYTKEFGWIKDLLDAGQTIGTILELASIAMHCGTKPGWGCLMALSKTIRECGMEMVMNLCPVQKQIADVVSVIGPLKNLPATLAQKGLDVAKDAAPDALKEIFDEKVPGSGGFDSDEIECEDSVSELTCPGFIPFGPKTPGKSGDEQDKQQEQPGQGDKQKEEDKGEPKPGGDEQKGDQGQPGKGEPKPGAPESEEGEQPSPTPSDKPSDKPGDTPSDTGKEAPGGDKPGSPEPDEKGEPQPGGTRPGGTEPGPGGTEPGGTDPGKAPGGTKPGGTDPGAGQGQGGTGPGTGGTGDKGGTGQGTGQGAGKPAGPLPKPEEVHKQLAKLLDEIGPEGMGALARLAEQAGMPPDAPLTADQVKKLKELLKKGQLKPEDLQKLAEGTATPKLQGQAKPLERFLDKAAHDAALKETLDKLRQKQYEFKFREMARLKMHWKIMIPYKPGKFRNAPALMWNDTIRAAGVVDGEFGKCVADGKVSLTITRADMREEGTMKKVIVHTPFTDKTAQVAGNVCPSAPPPSGGKGGGKGGGQGGGKGEGDQGEGGGKGGEADKGGGGQGQGEGQGKDQGEGKGGGEQKGGGTPAEGGEKESGEGEAEPGSEVNSGVRDGRDQKKDEGKDQDTDQQEQPKEEKQPGGETFGIDMNGLMGACHLPEKCAPTDWKVDFEELGGDPDEGWQVLPAKENSDGTNSLLNPPNKVSPFSHRPATDGSKDEEMIITCDGETCVVGRLRPTPGRPGMWELVSGPLRDNLRKTLRDFITKKRNGSTNRVERLHFF